MNSSRMRAAILGHMVGDALGVPVEFRSRQELDANPVVSMRGFGTHHQPAGTWSDDGSLLLATVDALLRARDEFQHTDTLFLDASLAHGAKSYVSWLTKGNYTPDGVVFDVGGTCRGAIATLARGGKPTEAGLSDERSNGNGSLMRILPLVAVYADQDPEIRAHAVGAWSSLTHAHPRSVLACCMYVEIALELLRGTAPSAAVSQGYATAVAQARSPGALRELHHFFRCNPAIASLHREEIRSTGYVVDSLEAALWCLLTSSNFPEAVLKAVNLGGDTDTIGALTGALAGLCWGEEAIPVVWTATMRMGLPERELIDAFLLRFTPASPLR